MSSSAEGWLLQNIPNAVFIFSSSSPLNCNKHTNTLQILCRSCWFRFGRLRNDLTLDAMVACEEQLCAPTTGFIRKQAATKQHFALKIVFYMRKNINVTFRTRGKERFNQ